MIISIVNPKTESLYGRFTAADDRFISFCEFLRDDCASYADLVVCIDSPKSHHVIPLPELMKGVF